MCWWFPLPERAIKRQDPPTQIGFGEGIDPTLQYICGANYSLYVHLTFAKVILTKWDDTSLDAVYTRLASAFDLFEALVIKFDLLCAIAKTAIRRFSKSFKKMNSCNLRNNTT